MQRLQGHDELGGRAVIDDDTVLLADLRRPFLGNLAAGRHQADVRIGEIIRVERLDLQRAVTIGHFRALAAARCKRDNFVSREAAFLEDIEHFAPDISGGADNCNLETHFSSPVPLRFQIRNPAGHAGLPPPGQTRGEGEQAKGIRPFSWSFW